MSSVLKTDEVTSEVQTFNLPDLENTGDGPASRYRMPSAKEIEDLYNSAYREGFSKGKEDGHKEVVKLAREQLDNLNNIIESIYQPAVDVENQLVQLLVQMSLNIAKNIIRRELKNDVGQIAGIVADSLKMLPISTEKITLVLSPGDAQFIRETYHNDNDKYDWNIREDTSISQGGCLLVTEASTIDARLETQLNELYYTMIGGTREDDDAAQ